eukprot:3521626-Alexandrium_andersonii.AAC.1
MLEAVFACSINADAARFDRFDSLLGSIGTRCICGSGKRREGLLGGYRCSESAMQPRRAECLPA